MTDAELARQAVLRHCSLFNDADLSGWLDNFTDSPVLEEPVGTTLREGREALKEMFEAFVAMGVRATMTSIQMIVNWPEAAVRMEVRLQIRTAVQDLEAIEIFTFADDGRVARIRTFVDTEAMAAALAPGT